MNKNRRKTMSSGHSSRKSEYEAFKTNELLQRQQRDSIGSVDDVNSSEFTSSQRMLFSTLLTDPEKRAQVYELLTKEGLVPNENKPLNGQQLAKKNRMQTLQEETGSPLRNNIKFRYESPSSKLRRRELEQLKGNEKKNASISSEEELDAQLPADQILRGVIAYCEVRSGEDDRSELIKRAMQAMGANVLERLNSRSVTHVVFRDGAYRTYERARLLGAKLVSVLWVEACRKKGRRVPEDRYPALGAKAPDFNLTTVCGNLQNSRHHTLHNSQTSIISLSEESNMSEQSGVVPLSRSSNDGMNNLSPANITDDRSQRISNDLAKHVLDSFELKHSKHIRSPESIAARQKRHSSEVEDDSLELQITSDQSKSHCSSVNESTKEPVLPKRRRDSEIPNRKEPNKASVRKSKDTLKRQSRRKSKNKNTPELITSSHSKTSIDSEKSISLHLTSDESKSKSTANSTDDTNIEGSNEVSIGKSSGISKRQTHDLTKHVNSRPRRTSRNKNTPEIITSSHSKISIESTESIRLHVTTDESKSESTTSKTVESNIIAENEAATKITSEKSTLDVKKPKRRRLYDPINYELNELEEKNFRWSQAPKLPLDLPNKRYQVEVPVILRTPKNFTRKAKKHLNKKKENSKTSSEADEKSKKVNKDLIERRTSLQNVRTTLFQTTKPEISNTINDKKVLAGNTTESSVTEKSNNVEKENLNNRRKSMRNLKKILSSAEKSPAENKSSTSSEYFSPEAKIVGKTKDKQKTIGKILYISPEPTLKKAETVLTEKVQNTPSRRSMRISMIVKTPIVPKNTNKKISEGNTPTKINKKKTVTKLPRKNIKIGDNKNIAAETNVSRLLDKMISKEVCERRSTFEFESENKPSTKKSPKKKYGTIVCTRLHREQTEVFIAIVRKLDGFINYENEVSSKTTHLVSGDTGRTVNMLLAITRGCWVLRHEWLLRSAAAGHWLPENEYELTEFSPAVKLSRTECEIFGRHYHMDVLAGKSIWVTPRSTPRRSDLQELVTLAGGKVATSPRKADLILGEYIPPPTICVSETWLLECITAYKFLTYEPYLLNAPEST